MDNLNANIYNQHANRDEPKMKVWRYAGLMLTYKCSAACEFCYYNCSPQSGGLMPIDTALSAWKSLLEMAPDTGSVHLTGGEPFLYFDHLAQIVVKAKDMGLTGLDSIETNASWATDRQIIIDRVKLLNAAGMDKLKISWDPFHARFIKQENVELLSEVASEILGKDRVMVRWSKYLQKPVKTRPFSAEEQMQEYIAATKDFPCRFTGKAAESLAKTLADKNVTEIAKNNCSGSFLSSKGVHIDPYGNVFSGLCSGIIVGNVNQKSLYDIWKDFNPEKDDYFSVLFCSGPAGFVNKAKENGYNLMEVYAGKCHLCTDIRSFFFDKECYRSIIGPSDCYGRHVE